MKIGGLLVLALIIWFLYGKLIKNEEAYLKSCKYKSGTIVYIKPDSSKVVIAGVVSSLGDIIFLTKREPSYEVIYVNGTKTQISESIIYPPKAE